MSGVRIVFVAALASAMCLTVVQAGAQSAGRSGATGMTAGQKASATRTAKSKFASCKRSANRQGLDFEARSTFMRQCLSG